MELLQFLDWLAMFLKTQRRVASAGEHSTNLLKRKHEVNEPRVMLVPPTRGSRKSLLERLERLSHLHKFFAFKALVDPSAAPQKVDVMHGSGVARKWSAQPTGVGISARPLDSRLSWTRSRYVTTGASRAPAEAIAGSRADCQIGSRLQLSERDPLPCDPSCTHLSIAFELALDRGLESADRERTRRAAGKETLKLAPPPRALPAVS
jgi:hypothetical protein